MEVVIAVTLLSMLSVGMLAAIRMGFDALHKTNTRLMENRRVAGAQRVLEQELGGFMPVKALCSRPNPPPTPFVFFQGQPQSMRLVSTYSLEEAWRGQPRILELQVIPGDEGRGVRLIVNEIPYTGPLSAGQSCLGMGPIPCRAFRCRNSGRFKLPRSRSCSPTNWPGAASRIWSRPSPRHRSLAHGLGPAALADGPARGNGAPRRQPRPPPPANHHHRHPHQPPAGQLCGLAAVGNWGAGLSPGPQRPPARTKSARGTALLAVLWLSAALATIAISLADTVRGEAERSATAVDGLRSQDLAIGGLRRAILYMDWGRRHPDIPRFKPPVPFFVFDFPEGQTVVDIIPETAKFNINNAQPDDLFRLLVNLGVDPAHAQDITAAIVDWRAPPPRFPAAPLRISMRRCIRPISRRTRVSRRSRSCCR
jgi:hypothetical protein